MRKPYYIIALYYAHKNVKTVRIEADRDKHLKKITSAKEKLKQKLDELSNHSNFRLKKQIMSLPENIRYHMQSVNLFYVTVHRKC